VIMGEELLDMDASALAKAVRADGPPPCPRLVMMTPAGKRGDAGRFERAGFSAYLTWPLSLPELRGGLAMAVADRPSDSGIVTRYTASEARGAMALVLVVDDNETNLLVAQAIIEKSGMRAKSAQGGQEALHALRLEPFGLVLMDCHMPGMDGYETTRRIRAEFGPGLPVIAMTASALAGDRQKCLDAGMDDYIAKPFLAEELLEKIGQWLAGGVKHAPRVGEAPEVGTLPDFDRELFLKRLLGNEEAARTIAAVFIKDARRLVEEVRETIGAGDVRALVLKAHTLKGACATMSALAMRELAAGIEDAAMEGDAGRAGLLAERLPEAFGKAERAIAAELSLQGRAA
jgi:CheY-like chemotaxis protein/HPt (histidine-containing phosphotransfer) domain-containing protein